MGIRVMVVERQQLVREGLASLLAGCPELELIAHTGDGSDGVRLASRWLPDVVILDLQISGLNAADATRRILSASPASGVLGLADDAPVHLMKAALDAGAHGILAKDGSADDLMRAIRAMSRRQRYISPTIADQVTGGRDGAFVHLTPKEREVVQLLAEGLSTKQIATRLCISFKTVATHREHAVAKLGARNVADLTRYAIREGLALA